MKNTQEVYLNAEHLGVSEINEDIATKITEGVQKKNGKLRLMLAAIIDTHTCIDDTKKLAEKFKKMTLSVKKSVRNKVFNSLSLVFNNIPEDCLLPQREGGLDLGKARKEKISKVLRDVVLPPSSNVDDIREHVKAYVERAGLLNVEPRPRTFVWGGHALPGGREGVEYKHAKKIGYLDALLNFTEFVTGCGDGIMRAPFSGARAAYDQHKLIWTQERFGIGLTEEKILAAEPPNTYVNKLIVFPDIALRIIAFVLSSHRGRVHPGGTGTLEEIMSFLALKSHDNNKDLYYPFDLVEPEGSEYMHKSIKNYLETCFNGELNKFFEIHNGEVPRDFAEYVLKTNIPSSHKTMWNKDVFVPEELHKPFEVTFENMEKLDLSRNQDIYNLTINLRNFFSALVHLTVKNPDLGKEWNGAKPLIRGDKEILEATNQLILEFYQQGRIHASGNLDKDFTKELPYRMD